MAELTEVQKLYKDLRKFVRRDNYTKAVNVCTQLRKKLPDDIEPLQCHCVCLLKGDKFQQSFDVATKAANGAPGSERDPTSFLLLERAYCLYRLNKLPAALKLLAGWRYGIAGGQSDFGHCDDWLLACRRRSLAACVGRVAYN